VRAARADLVPLDYRTTGILINHDCIMATFKFYDVVKDLRAICTIWISHEGDSRVVSVTAAVNAKTSGARARICTIPIVVDVVVLDSNTWLDKIREDDTAARRIPNFKAIDRDIGIRRLTRSTRAYNAIGPSRATIKHRKISAAIIAEGDWVALTPVDI